MSLLNQRQNLGINLAGCSFTALQGSVAAQITIGHNLGSHHIKFFRHAKTCYHAACQLCSLLDIIGSAAGNAAENNLLSTAAACHGYNLVEQLFLGHQHAVIFADLHGVAQSAVGTRNNSNLMYRSTVLLHSSHKCVTDFVVGNNLFLCGRNYRALALVTGDNSFNGFLQIFLLHHVTMHFYSSQRTLIDNIGKLCTAGSGCCPRQRAIVDIVCHTHVTCMNLQDSLTALKIRQLNRNTAVKTSRTQQRLIQRFRTVGSCQNNYTLAAVKTVHLTQQLIQSLLAFIIAAELTVITAFADGIDFIDKYYARCLFLRLLEQIAHTGSAHADEHFYKFTAADAEERHLGFACYRTRQQGFTRTGRAY